MEQDINKLIEELTKVRPDELSTDGLKLFEYINEIIDKNKELKEENEITKRNYNTLCADIQMVIDELGFPEDTIIADEMIPMIKENYIPVYLIEEKIEEYTKLLKNCNRFSDVNRIKAINERILAYKELLEKRKKK